MSLRLSKSVLRGISDAPSGYDAQLWAQAWVRSTLYGGTQQSQYQYLVNTLAGGSIYEQQATPGFPSTWNAITIWARSGSIHAPWAPSSIEIDAVTSYNGWIKTDTGSVIQLTDQRYAKMPDGHWENRNHPGVNLGYAIAAAAQPPTSAIEKAEASFMSGAQTAVNDVGSGANAVVDVAKGAAQAAGDVASALVGPVADIASAIWEFIKEVGADAEDLLKLAGFLLQCAEKLVTGQLDELDPFKQGSLVYNFINDVSNSGPLEMLVILIILGPLAIAVAPLYAAFSHSTNFLGGGAISASVKALRDLTSGVASGKSMFDIAIEIVQDVVLGIVGVPIGPATAIKIVYLILSGLPIPPLMAIADAILADPVAQAAVGNAFPISKPVVDEWMPIVMSCLNASDANQWLTCVTDVVEALFPNIIRGLQRFAIDLNDLRTVIQSAWETGGDVALMLGSAASAASNVFGASFGNITPVQDAMIGIGFFGVGYIMKQIGIDGAETFFVDTFMPLLPSNVRTAVSSAYDVFRFVEQLIIDAGNARVQLTSSQSPSGFVLYLLETFHDAQWDVEIAVTSLIADEFDPNPRTTRLFSSNIKRDSSGHFIVSAPLKALWTKLELDFPRLKYQMAMLAAKLGIGDGELLGSRTDIDAARSALGISVPSNPKSLSYKKSPVAIVPQQMPTSIGSSGTSANEGQGLTAKQPASSASSATGEAALVAGATAAGAAAGGLPGALLGAGAALLLGGNGSNGS